MLTGSIFLNALLSLNNIIGKVMISLTLSGRQMRDYKPEARFIFSAMVIAILMLITIPT